MLLSSDPTKLRWLGIDMHGRGQRRCAVALHCVVFFIGVNTLSIGTAHTAVLQQLHLGFWLMVLLAWLCSQGILREGGVLKDLRDPVRKVRGYGDMVMLSGLDDRAVYFYGDQFEALDETQQKDILDRYRVGNYYFPAKASRTSNDRERMESYYASSVVLTKLTGLTFTVAWLYALSSPRARYRR